MPLSDHVRRNTKEPPTERVGDATGQSPDTQATDRQSASDLANTLKDMSFPATKQEIQRHVNAKSSGRDLTSVVARVNGLREGISYNSVSEVEKAEGLVRDVGK